MHSRVLVSLAAGLIGSKAVNARVACRLSSSSTYNAAEVTTTSSIDVSGPSATIETLSAETPTIESSTETPIVELSTTELPTIEISATETTTIETLTTETAVVAPTTETTIDVTTTEAATTDVVIETTASTLNPTPAATTEPAAPASSGFQVTDDFGEYLQAGDVPGLSSQMQSAAGPTFTISDDTGLFSLEGGRSLCALYTNQVQGRATVVTCPDTFTPANNYAYLECVLLATNTISCTVSARVCGGMSCSPTSGIYDTFYTYGTAVLWIGPPSTDADAEYRLLSAMSPEPTQ